VVGLLLVAGWEGAGVTSIADAATPATKKPAHELSRREKARLRKTLARQLRRNPSVILKRSFIRKAALVEFHLPMSVRLSPSDGQGGFQPSDDQLEIDWDDSAFSWPLAAAGGITAAPQVVSLSGGFTLDAVFGGGDTTGYGELGATETLMGGAIAMHSGSFTISEFEPACPSGPQLATDPGAQVSITSAGARFGVLNLFSDEIRGTLSLRMSFASNVAASCGATPQLTPVVDNTMAAPMPVRLDGKFVISPAITPDGDMRFGKITIDDAVDPQLSTFAFVRACTDLTPTCAPQQFPARLKLKKLTAEVLLGRVLP
jgi:hypothetical protein